MPVGIVAGTMRQTWLGRAWASLAHHLRTCAACADVVRHQRHPEDLCPDGAGLYSEWLMARHLAS